MNGSEQVHAANSAYTVPTPLDTSGGRARAEHGQVAQNMRLIRVKQRDVVKLRWGTDQPLTLHLHGYDIEQKVEAGTIAEMKFTARATGRFPVHLHDARERAGSHSHHEPPLVLIEVYPQ